MTRRDGRGMAGNLQDDVYGLLADAQEQLLARDDAIRSLRSEEFAQLGDVVAAQNEEIRWLEGLLAHRDREIGWLRGVLKDRERESSALRGRIADLEHSLRSLQATRLWRLGQRYWRLRDRFLRRPTTSR